MSEQETIWVCTACGKTAEEPYDFSDPSCAMNSALCYVEKLEYREDAKIVKSVEEGGVVEPQPKWYENEEE